MTRKMKAMLHTETDTAFAIWRAIVVIFAVLCILAGTLFGAFISGKIGAALGFISGAAVATIAVGIWVGVTWPPFASQYHTYVPTTITVASTSSRILNDGQGNVSQRIAVLGTNGQTYGCDDTRCTVLAKGDVVTLMCEAEWETNGSPGEVCNWGKIGANV
jgi:hypothetical protein